MSHKQKKYAVSNSVSVHATDTRETTQSLALAMSQIDMALKEANTSVTELIGSVASMASAAIRIESKIEELRKLDDSSDLADEIENNCKQAEKGMQDAIMAFQFYDRLSQRFIHVRENLDAVADVIKAPDKQHPEMWQKLHEKVRSVYSLEQEQYLSQQYHDGSLNEGEINAQLPENEEQKSNDGMELF